MTTDTQRAAFEAWWASKHPLANSMNLRHYFKKDGSGFYGDAKVQWQWDAWQVATDAARGTAEQVRRDAERYRYLRNDTKRDADPDNAMYVSAPGGEDVLTGWVLDSQIDLALAASPAPETPRTTDEGERDGNFASWARSNYTTANDLDLINPAIRSAWNAAWKFCAPRTMAAQPAAPEGWKLVPKEPTEAMIAATNDALEQVNGIILLAAATGRGHIDAHRDGPPLVRAYRAMLAASPEAPGAQADARSTSDLEDEMHAHTKAALGDARVKLTGSDDIGDLFEDSSTSDAAVVLPELSFDDAMHFGAISTKRLNELRIEAVLKDREQR